MRNLRDYYKRAKALVEAQNKAIEEAEAEFQKIAQDSRYSKEYRNAARQTMEQKIQEARARCEAGMELLKKDFRQAAFKELMPDYESTSPSLIRTLENVNLSPAELQYVAADLRDKGDLMACRLLRDYAEKRGYVTKNLYTSPEEAIASFDRFTDSVSEYGFADMPAEDRLFTDLNDFDEQIQAVWNFGEKGLPEVAVYDSADTELAAQLHAQHDEQTEAQKQAFLRGWDPASADTAERMALMAQAQQALWKDGALTDTTLTAVETLLKSPETVKALAQQTKSEATRAALEALQASLQAQADTNSGQDPEGAGASDAEITSPF